MAGILAHPQHTRVREPRSTHTNQREPKLVIVEQLEALGLPFIDVGDLDAAILKNGDETADASSDVFM